MRKLIVALVVVVFLALAADRAAALAAEHVAATQVQSRLALADKPDVSVDGFPFLTQVLRGRLTQVRVTAQDVPLGRFRADSLSVTAQQLQVNRQIPLDSRAGHVEAVAVVPYSEVSRLAPEGVRVGPADAGSGDALRVTAPLDLPGRSTKAVATSHVRVHGGLLVVRAGRVVVGGHPLAPALAARARGRLDFSVPVRGLPGGLHLSGVRATSHGLQVTVTGRRLALARVVAAWQ